MPRSTRRRWTRRSAAEVRQVLGELDRSGLSQKAFAARAGFPLSTLSWWRRRLREMEGGPRRARDRALVPVVIRPAAAAEEAVDSVDAASGFEIRLRSGVVVHVPSGFDERSLGRLIAVLGGP